MNTFYEKVGEDLIRKDRLSLGNLNKALEIHRETNQNLPEILVERGFSSSADIARSYSEILEIEFFELEEDFHLDREEYKLLPESIARRYGLFPLKRDEGVSVTVVMSNPLDMEALATVQSFTSLEVHKAVAPIDRIEGLIERCYNDEAYLKTDLEEIVDLDENWGKATEESGESDDQLLLDASDAPVVRYVNLILKEAVREGASDIHFEPGENRCQVRLRIDGALQASTPPPKNLYSAIITRIKVLSEMDIAERRLPQDGRLKFKFDGRVIDVRVSSMPLIFGEKVVMRILDKGNLVFDLAELGFEGENLTDFQRILKMPNGIVLLTGPTGSGKTTTLYSALNLLNSPDMNIQTVEDPVEYMVEGVNQMPTNSSIGLNFAECLRHILRQDPDAVMIGEIRDAETAEIAMRASLTGHIVLSTLHTNDATSAFSRLRDIGIPSFMAAATVRLIIAQRLAKRICPSCKTRYTPDDADLAWARSVVPDAEQIPMYHGKGCDDCKGRGIKGRRAIFEFLKTTPEIRELVHHEVDDFTLRKEAIRQGMETLAENGMYRVRQGEVTLPETMRICQSD